MRRRALGAAAVGALAALPALAGPAPVAVAAEPVAHISAFHPDDPGYRLQWNLKGRWGIRMPQAWAIAKRQGVAGGQGAVVAILDTGVAYRTAGAYRRAPDLRSFVPGHDFVAGDSVPLDENGHGTHVAGTVAEAADNGIAAAGIAYRARIMPVRVLDARGDGDMDAVARGVRWAADQRADVLNLSFEFPPSTQPADVQPVLDALRYAHDRGAVIVASSGNRARDQVALPARAPEVIAVGATTERGCRASYSGGGAELDVVAPGGGADAADGEGPAGPGSCAPGQPGLPIYQQTFTYDPRSFGLPGGHRGTSFAAPHVSGVAALVVAAARRRRMRPSPAEVQARIERSARDLGPAGPDPGYGHGLVDAAAALR